MEKMTSGHPAPLVSILVNNYNYGCYLSAAIDSALKQSHPFVEVVVVDDGSTDNSHQVIASYGHQITPVFKENGGQASAFNAGFEASQGEIICILDADDLFHPGKVDRIVQIFIDHPAADWCFHSLQLFDKEPKISLAATHNAIPKKCDFRSQMCLSGKLPTYFPATSGLCFKRSLLQKILPMPAAKNISLGDHYLKFLAAALSPGIILDETLALQRLHPNNAYTQKADNLQVKGRIFSLTAYWMRVNFPHLSKFTNNIFAQGISFYWRSGGTERDYQEIIRNYFSSASFKERLEINLRIAYRCFLPK